MPHFSFSFYNIFKYLRCSDPSLSTSPRCRSESSDFCSSQFLLKRDEPKAEVILGVPETYESQNPPSLWPGQYNVKLAVGQNVSLSRQGPRFSIRMVIGIFCSDTVFVQLNQFSQILSRQCCLLLAYIIQSLPKCLT